VTREDQKRINAFGRLNNRLHDVEAELEGKKAREGCGRRGSAPLFVCAHSPSLPPPLEVA